MYVDMCVCGYDDLVFCTFVDMKYCGFQIYVDMSLSIKEVWWMCGYLDLCACDYGIM